MGDAGPRFSIITATFNAGIALQRTLESIRAQTCTDFQWIVIDGGSKDDTLERVRAAGNLVSEWVSEPDEGIADAWNKGIDRAAGAHVLILNAGDTYDPDFLERISAHCCDTAITCAHARVCTQAGEQVSIMRARPGKLRRGMYVPHNWCAVPRAFYEELGHYAKLPLAMDFEWFHRYYKRFGASGFRVVDAVLGTYYLGGVSDVNFRRSFKANEEILIAQGTHALLAKALCWSTSAKHFLYRRMWR